MKYMLEVMKVKFEKWSKKKIKNFVAQSYSIWMPLAIYLVTFLLQVISKLFSNESPNFFDALATVWTEQTYNNIGSLIVPLALAILYIILCVVVKVVKKYKNIKSKKTEVNHILDEMQGLSEEAKNSRDENTYIVNQFEEIKNKVNKYALEIFLEPINKRLKDISDYINSQYSIIDDYVKNKRNQMQNKDKYEQSDIDDVNDSFERTKDISNEIKEKIIELNLLYELAKEAHKKIQDETNKNKSMLRTYYMRNDNVDLILRIKLQNNKYIGTIFKNNSPPSTYNVIFNSVAQAKKTLVILMGQKEGNYESSYVFSAYKEINHNKHSVCIGTMCTVYSITGLIISDVNDTILGDNSVRLSEIDDANMTPDTISDIISKLKIKLNDKEYKKLLNRLKTEMGKDTHDDSNKVHS